METLDITRPLSVLPPVWRTDISVFVELFPNEEQTVRHQLIEAKVFLTYQRQLNNLHSRKPAIAPARLRGSLSPAVCG